MSAFSAEGLELLRRLPDHDKAAFEEGRARYRELVAEPAKRFVEAVGAGLAERVSPGLVAQPKTNGSIAPINNDLRFAPEASPYKDHLMFRFWEGTPKKTAPTIMIRVHPDDGTGFAEHLAFADLARWRDLVAADDPGEELASVIATLVAETGAELVGSALRRVPKPFDAGHPRGDLLRHKALQVRWIPEEGPPPDADDHVDWCVGEAARARHLHRLLVDRFG